MLCNKLEQLVYLLQDYHFSWKNLKFENLGIKTLEKPGFLKKDLENPEILNIYNTFCRKTSIWQKIYGINKTFLLSPKIFILKIT